jgi:UDP-N-acetylmuramate dehydrogenase
LPNPNAGAFVNPDEAGVNIQARVPLAPRTTLKLGGPARWFASATSEAELASAFEWARASGVRTWVLGGGSNVVLPDAGLEGLVVSVEPRGIECRNEGEFCLVSAKAGEPWDALVAFSVESGLAGLECLSGIPGLVGATPVQNVGAYGQEVKDTIRHVRAFDLVQRAFVELDGADCAFGYRDSRFKSLEPGRFVVSEVTFALRRNGEPSVRYPELARSLAGLGRAPTLSEVRSAVIALRRSKSMVLEEGDPNARSCGSFFVNPVVPRAVSEEAARRLGGHEMPQFPQPDGRIKLSAAWLIEHCGFNRGLRRGSVGLSSRHTLALVCHEGASTRALLDFAKEVQEGVKERSGVELTPEPSLW